MSAALELFVPKHGEETKRTHEREEEEQQQKKIIIIHHHQMQGARQSDVFFGERESGQDVRQSNATAVQAVANIVRSSLGPVGLDKVCDDYSKRVSEGKVNARCGIIMDRFFSLSLCFCASSSLDVWRVLCTVSKRAECVLIIALFL